MFDPRPPLPPPPSHHYANMSVQCTANFSGCKNDDFQLKVLGVVFLLILLKTQIVGTS